MRHRILVVAGLMGLLAAGARSQQAAAAPAKITGTVTYRERIALPPDAIVQLRLDEMSQAEAPPRRLAEASVRTDGKQVPIPFELPYAAADIKTNGRYVVRAKIVAGGKTLFSSKTPYAVLTRGAPSRLEILVQQGAGGGPGRPKPAPTAAETRLAGVEWKLVALGSEPGAPPADGPPPGFLLDAGKKSLSGTTGCNRFAGSFTLAEGRLRLDPGAMTMMACPEETMRREQAFIEALKATTGYRIEGGALELLEADGRVLARFVSGGDAGAARSH